MPRVLWEEESRVSSIPENDPRQCPESVTLMCSAARLGGSSFATSEPVTAHHSTAQRGTNHCRKTRLLRVGFFVFNTRGLKKKKKKKAVLSFVSFVLFGRGAPGHEYSGET